MKKASVFLAIFISFVFSLFFFNSFLSRNLTQLGSDNYIKTDENLNSVPKNQIQIEKNDILYNINWIEISDIESLTLHSNLTEKLISKQAKDSHKCDFLVNGGFYDKSDRHIGYFREGQNILSQPKNSPTFNSYIAVNSDFEAIISHDLSSDDVLYALQTGPMLLTEEEPLNIQIKNDKNARRVVASINENNDFVFMIIYDIKTGFSGPRLGELPDFLEEFIIKTGINLLIATNLDGGGASAFISEDVSITESQLIGSYFCLR